MSEINKYYSFRKESERLLKNEGLLELQRTKEIIERHLNNDVRTIYDIGGGDGIYSRWLAEKGYDVHLSDISENQIQFAKDEQQKLPLLASIINSDARNIEANDSCCEGILLLGPLYHLTEKQDRILLLKKVFKMLKPGGVLFVSAISRYGSFLKALKGYGIKYDTLHELEFQKMIINEIQSGQHVRPNCYPNFLPSAYFHSPEELESEVSEAGFKISDLISIEGPFWLNDNFSNDWTSCLPKIMDVISAVERDKNLMSLSLHFMGIGTKP